MSEKIDNQINDSEGSNDSFFEIEDIFTKEENDSFNSNSFYDVDWNDDYKTTIKNILQRIGFKSMPAELENDWQQFLKRYTEGYIRQLQIRRSNPSPAVIGPSNFNFRRRDKLMAREQKASESNDMLFSIFKRKVRKYNFQQGNIQTAEQRRQGKREAADKVISVGSSVNDLIFGIGIVTKINTKTYTIKFNEQFKCTRDKCLVMPIEPNPVVKINVEPSLTTGSSNSPSNPGINQNEFDAIRQIRKANEHSKDQFERNI